MSNSGLNKDIFEKPVSYRSHADVSRRRNLYANFFREDLARFVMPHTASRSSTGAKYFEAKLLGEKEDCEKFKQLLSELGVRHRYDADYLCDLINKISSNLTNSGSLYFEVLRSKIRPNLHMLHRFNSPKIYNFFFAYLQISKNSDSGYVYDGDNDEPKNKFLNYKFAFISRKKAWVVNFPESLGGKRNYKKILSKLDKHGDMPDEFSLPDSSGRTVEGFDFKFASKNTVVFREFLTKNFGYNFRGSSDEYITEFLMVHRYVKHHITKSIIRKHIIDELNSLTLRLGIKTNVVVSGLPSENYLRAVQYKLSNRRISFKQAMDECDY